MRVNLTTNVASAIKSKPVNSSSSSASDFKGALVSANHLPAPARTSTAREKSDVQSKQKRNDEPSKPDTAGQGHASVEQTGVVQPKPVLALPSQQSADGTEENVADESSVNGIQAASANGVSVSNSSEWPSVSGDHAGQSLLPTNQAVSSPTDAEAGVQGDPKEVDAAKSGKEDQVSGTDADRLVSSSVQSSTGLALSQDLLRSGSSKALQAAIDGVAVSGTNKKTEDSEKSQAAASKTPLNSQPDTQPPAQPVETAVQTVSPTALPTNSQDISSTVPNKPLEQMEGTGSAARKTPALVDAKSRRKSDEDAAETTPVIRTSAPDFSVPRSATDSAARLDQTNEQMQASQTGISPAPQDHAKVDSPASDIGPSLASASQAASDVQASETVSMQGLSGAHLVQSIHQSEMKLGLNSVEFGSISINTSVTHQVLSAQISLDHPELSRILSAHMPAVEEKLGQAYGLQTRVEVRDGSSAQSGARHQGQDSDSARSRQSTQFGRSGVTSAMSAIAGTSIISDVARLDVRV